VAILAERARKSFPLNSLTEAQGRLVEAE